jgi:hypothetical protein
MPRVTFAGYLKRRSKLVHEYTRHDSNAFVVLESHQQWGLYEYFQPRRQLTDNELMAHHEACAQQDPSLPQRAGRAYGRIEPILAIPDEQRTTGVDQFVSRYGTKEVMVWPKVRPEINYKQVARALILLARNEMKRKP